MRSKHRFSLTCFANSRTRKPKNKSSLPSKIITSRLTFIFLSSIPILLTNKHNRSFIAPIISLTLTFTLIRKSLYTPIPKLFRVLNMMFSDLISRSLAMLTLYLVILCYIVSTPLISTYKYTSYNILLWGLTIILVLCFCFKNIFWFYIAFEFALIPTILLIIGWGYQEERFQASFYLIIFTITTSLPILIILILIRKTNNSTFIYTLNSLNLANSLSADTFLWAALIVVFIVKLPIYLFHLWLPKAHVEAPVVGSMLLAGILLKLGGYGFIRFASMLPHKLPLLSNAIATISIWGAIITALICTTQIDMKALIAYSSITHISLIILAISSATNWGWQRALTIIISHGLCSSGLFSAAGILYDYTASRNLFLNKGLLIIFPSLIIWLFILSAFNFGAPPSINIIGELIAITASTSISLLTIPGLILILVVAGWYSITLYITLSHGQLPSLFNPMINITPRIHLVILGHLIPLIIYLLHPSLILEWL